MKNNIASERMRRGLSQKELGLLLNRSANAIQKLESGAYALKDEDLVALSRIFGCSTDYLLDLVEERTRLILNVRGNTVERADR